MYINDYYFFVCYYRLCSDESNYDVQDDEIIDEDSTLIHETDHETLTHDTHHNEHDEQQQKHEDDQEQKYEHEREHEYAYQSSEEGHAKEQV